MRLLGKSGNQEQQQESENNDFFIPEVLAVCGPTKILHSVRPARGGIKLGQPFACLNYLCGNFKNPLIMEYRIEKRHHG